MAVDQLASTRESLLGEQSKLAGMQEQLPSLADKLREALTSRLENPMIGQRNQAISNFFQTAPRTRTEAAGLLGVEGAPANPTAVENLVSQRRSTALMLVMNLSNMMQAQQGGIEDVISKGTNAFQSMVNAQQGRVGLAQTDYNLALQELTRQAEELQREVELKKITGGTVTLPSGETINIPSEVQRTLATKTGGAKDIYDQLSKMVGAKGDIQKLMGLPEIKGSDKTTLNQAKALVDQINKIQSDLGDPQSGVIGWLKNVFTQKTGLPSQVLGQYRGGADIRSAISNLEKAIKRNAYGSVLSKYELKEYPKWGVSSSKEETANWNNLEAMKNEAMYKVNSILGDYGTQYLQTGNLPEVDFNALLQGLTSGNSQYGAWE